jgi:capping protein beta
MSINSALNITRRMPPKDIEDNLSGLISLIPDETDELLQRVDQPLEIAIDPTLNRQYLKCDYNRDGDSYR